MNWVVIALLCAMFLGLVTSPSHDDTDPPSGHSGMTLYTDQRTGCQYMGTGFGGLTPRMSQDGKQICEVKQ